MVTQETTPAGYWTWEPEGKSVRIQLSFEVVDRMLSTVLDGFGSVPKRGMEVGGVLLGHRTRNDGRLEVKIDDYLSVTCAHRFGPSFVLSDEDLEGFEATVQQNSGIVGYFRSHTRDGLALGTEDLQYCQKLFDNPDDVILLVRPSGMKVSKAGFFCYESGAIQDTTDLEFPFRRSELETGEAPPRRPLGERRPPPNFDPPVARDPRPPRSEGMYNDPISARDPFGSGAGSQQQQQPQQAAPPPPTSVQMPSGRNLQLARQQQMQYTAGPAMSAAKIRRNWVWFPLSFIFLLLGVGLGFQAALTFNSSRSTSQDPYALSLNVERRESDLSIRWDRSNQAIRTASKAVLEIQDGRYTKKVDLDSAQLQTGTVIYRFSSNEVKFRLEVFAKDRFSISEWVEWKSKP